MTPLHDYVLLEVVKEKNETGIILPDEVDVPQPNRGKVLAVAQQVKEVSVGDSVLFKTHLFEEIKEGLIGKVSGIIAIL